MNTKVNKQTKQNNTIKDVYQQKHNDQPYIKMCLQTKLLTELYEAKNLVFNRLNRTLGNSNIFWQYFIISISVLLNNVIKIDL